MRCAAQYLELAKQNGLTRDGIVKVRRWGNQMHTTRACCLEPGCTVRAWTEAGQPRAALLS